MGSDSHGSPLDGRGTINLARSFAILSASRTPLFPGTFAVEPIAAPQETYLACSADGRPGLFIAVEPSEGPGIKLRNMEMRHGTVGNLRTAAGGSIVGTYTLIECLSNDARLHQAFIELVSEVLRPKKRWANTDELELGFASLIELFRAGAMPSTATWLGLWGELFLMHASPSPAALLAAWHVDPFKLHDFSLGSERLECKTTSGNTRLHEFNLRQLEEAEHQVFIASIVTHESLGGVTALMLYDELRRRVRKPELRVHLDRVIAQSLGEEFDSGSAPRFDYREARETLRVVAASGVPAPMNPFPSEVDHVRFRSNLSRCAQVEVESTLLRLLA